MAGNFDLPPWLTTQTPWSGSDAFIKGSQAGAAIAANRLRAKQLYVEVQQNQQRMDLAERQFAVENESATLKNEVARTKMANDAADFEALRKWYPEFLKSDGDMAPPILYNENAMLKVSSEIATKRSKVGMAAFAAFMAEPGRDLNRPEDRVKYYDLLAKYQNIPDKLGPDGIMAPIKMAESLKRLRDEADSRIASREDRADYNAKQLALRQLLADHNIPLTDARVVKAQQDAAMAERELVIKEKNVGLRGQEVALKEKRFDMAKWSPEDRTELKERTKVVHDDSTLTSAEKDQAIQEIRGEIEGNRLQREKIKEAKTVRSGLKADLDSEIKMANEAIAANPDRKAAIAEQFKKRTGRDLP